MERNRRNYEAVLDVMGMKWNDEKDGVEENI